jgi:hypothetical protein
MSQLELARVLPPSDMALAGLKLTPETGAVWLLKISNN